MNEELTYLEFKPWITKMGEKSMRGRMSEEQKIQVFNEIDLNHDGFISKNEFRLYMKRML